MKKKEKDKYVSEIVEPVCKKMGFHKIEYNDVDGSFWEFVRTKDGIKQVIELLNGRYLEMRFRTNLYGQRTVSTNEIWKGNTKWDEFGIYPYKDNTEFENILKFYATLIVEKAEEVFASISVRIIPEISLEDYEYLKKLCLERKENSPVELSLLQDKVRALSDKKFEDIKYDLLEISFEYGNWIIANFGGRWGSFYEQFGVMEVGPKKTCGNVIHEIYVFWKRMLSFEERAIKNIYSIPYENEFSIPAISDEDYQYLKELSESQKTDRSITIEEIQERINTLKGEDFKIIKNKLLLLAVDYGNCLIANYGGGWNWIEGGYGIEKVGREKQYVNVIIDVYSGWKTPYPLDRETIESQYLLC